MKRKVTVTRWRRYAQDRLYVAVDGQDVGWHCLRTGDGKPPADPDLDLLFREAVGTWLDEQSAGQPVEPGRLPRQAAPSAPTPGAEPARDQPAGTKPEPESDPSGPRPPAGPGFDLAFNPPAAAVLAKADELAAPRLAAEARLRRQADEAVAVLRHTAVSAEAEFRRLHPVRAFWRRLFAPARPIEPQLAAEWHRIMAQVPPMSAEEKAFRVGAEGEQATALMLRGVPGWQALHAVPVGSRNADIDHVVIGPGGVFTLNSKHHQGASVWVGGDAFRVNRMWTRYVEKARFEADRAADLLGAAAGAPVPVTAVIVLVGVGRLTVKAPPAGVEVVKGEDLRSWLSSRPRVFGPEEVDRLFGLARDSATWTVPAPAAQDL